jgi:hypothetical protein
VKSQSKLRLLENAKGKNRTFKKYTRIKTIKK